MAGTTIHPALVVVATVLVMSLLYDFMNVSPEKQAVRQVVSVREDTEDESQQRILPTPVRPVAGTAPAGGSQAIATLPLPVTTALATVATTKATAAPKIVAVTVPNVPNVAVTVGNERGTAKDNTDLKQVELVRSRIKANPPESFHEILQGPKTLAPTPAHFIDVVSPTIVNDFEQINKNQGLESWLRHIKNIRSLTFLSRPQDLEGLREIIRNKTTIPKDFPIRYFDETYFSTVYRKHYGDMGYWRVYQQMMKMHVFDMPWLLPNVLILDSDTVWSRDHTLVFPNGSVSYYNDFYFKGVGGSPEWESNRRKCLGGDPVKVVNSLFKDIGCNFSKYCGTLESSGARHIMHHMLFQRDVMADMHASIMRAHGGGSLWEAGARCWKLTPKGGCQGRVAEYEIYYTFVDCKYHDRVLDVSPPVIASGGNCTPGEMDICAAKGVLLKMCNGPGIHGRGPCSSLREGRERWTQVW
eukprot:m.70043 g.70043  ORF g.70043 m.70043 type:complete len:470 (-) comp9994_c0_seq2:260-1669(-)